MGPSKEREGARRTKGGRHEGMSQIIRGTLRLARVVVLTVTPSQEAFDRAHLLDPPPFAAFSRPPSYPLQSLPPIGNSCPKLLAPSLHPSPPISCTGQTLSACLASPLYLGNNTI
eukprot:TRINITY_DN832_c0_g1_i1.p2 TRINITY_DN832_c0_g1~~TRINITY_DN832_c0_g1_i1.p2  ORF type:complete len:115 (-),score=5.75 TRINITY_DN832_c0_g1_i1:1686-2030(-)